MVGRAFGSRYALSILQTRGGRCTVHFSRPAVHIFHSESRSFWDTPKRQDVEKTNMAKEIYVSKVFAIITVTLTASAIAGIVSMVIVYQIQMDGVDPTPRPTRPPPTVLPTGPPPDMRLPGNLVPNSYRLFIQPHLYPSLNMSDVNETDQIMVFTGNSTVVFQCIEKTKTIILHSNNLTLVGLNVTDLDSGKLLPFSKYLQYDDLTDFLEIQMSDALTEGGNYSLFVDFQGEMLDDLRGLYVSTYNEDGLKK